MMLNFLAVQKNVQKFFKKVKMENNDQIKEGSCDIQLEKIENEEMEQKPLIIPLDPDSKEDVDNVKLFCSQEDVFQKTQEDETVNHENENHINTRCSERLRKRRQSEVNDNDVYKFKELKIGSKVPLMKKINPKVIKRTRNMSPRNSKRSKKSQRHDLMLEVLYLKECYLFFKF